MKKNVLSNAFLYVIGSVFVQGLTFLTLPIFTRIMLPSDFAIVASYNFWISLISIFVGVKLEGSINNALVDFKDKSFDKYVFNMFYPTLVLFIFIFIITICFGNIISAIFHLPLYVLIIGIVQSLFSFSLTLLTSKFVSQNKPLHYLIISILNASLNIFLAIYLVNSFSVNKYLGRVYSFFAASFIFGIISFYILFKEGKCKVVKEYIVYGLSFSLPLIFHALSQIILSRCDQMMILNLINDTQSGIYAFASNFGLIISVIFNAFNQAYVPWYYKAISNGEVYLERYIKRFMNIGSLITLTLLLFLPEIVKIMGGNDYLSARYIAPFLVVGFFFNFLYMFPVNYEFYHKKTKFISIGTIGAAIINIILNYLLVPKLGSVGAAITTMTSYFILIVFHYYLAEIKIKQFNISFFVFFKNVFIAIIYLLLYFVLLKFLLIRWAIGIILVIILLFILIKGNIFMNEF